MAGTVWINSEFQDSTRDMDSTRYFSVPGDFVALAYVHKDDGGVANKRFCGLYIVGNDGRFSFGLVVVDTFYDAVMICATRKDAARDEH